MPLLFPDLREKQGARRNGKNTLYYESHNVLPMKRPLLMSALLLGTLTLSGCTTTEVHQEKPVNDSLDFSDLKKAAAENALNAKSQSAPQASPTQPITPPVNNKKMYPYPPVMSIDSTKSYTATLTTSAGVMTVELNAKATPVTANNFVFLAKEKFYDGTIFHRVMKGFMIQGGDQTGTGMGDAGYKFNDEPVTAKYERGTIAMANSGPNTNGSQFFIMHEDYPLPPNYVIFGKVTEGLETLDAIANAPVESDGRGELSKPVTPVTITSVTISEK